MSKYFCVRILCHKCNHVLFSRAIFFYRRNLKNEQINHNKVHSMCHVNVFRIRFVVSGFACNRERERGAKKQDHSCFFTRSGHTTLNLYCWQQMFFPLHFPHFPSSVNPISFLFTFSPFFFFIFSSASRHCPRVRGSFSRSFYLPLCSHPLRPF